MRERSEIGEGAVPRIPTRTDENDGEKATSNELSTPALRALGFPGRTRELLAPPIAEINGRASELRAQGRLLFDLGQAILGLRPPASAITALRAFVEETQVHAYSPDPGLPSVRERVARFLREHKALTRATAAEVMLTCGANQAFANAIFTLTQPGDEVIVFGPHYFDHIYSIRLAGCVEVEIALRRRSELEAGRTVAETEDDPYMLDLASVEAAITPRTRCITLISPSNPAAMVVSRGQLLRLCELCRRHRLWLVSDETYDLLCFEPHEHTSAAALGVWPYIVTLGSFSKTLALAAWRIGYLHAPVEVIEEAIKVQDALVVCAPVAAQRAVEAALDEAAEFAQRARVELSLRKRVLFEGLHGHPDFELIPSQGATFALARLREPLDDVAYVRALLEKAGVVTVPGSAFGVHGRGCVRFSFGNLEVQPLAEACQRIRGFRWGDGG